jgi:hypothetical protein
MCFSRKRRTCESLYRITFMWCCISILPLVQIKRPNMSFYSPAQKLMAFRCFFAFAPDASVI